MRWLLLGLSILCAAPVVACPKCGPSCDGSCECGCGPRDKRVAPPPVKPQQGKKPQLMIFTQKGCPPCKAFVLELNRGTTWAELKSRYEIFVIDVDKYAAFAEKHGVESVPYFKDSFGRIWDEGYLTGEMEAFLLFFTGLKPDGDPPRYRRDVPAGPVPPPPDIEDAPPPPPVESGGGPTPDFQLQLADLAKQLKELRDHLPQGQKGDKGDKGDPGERGEPGKDGRDGITPEVDSEAIVAAVIAKLELTLAELEARIALLEALPEPQPADGRVLYFTSRDLSRVKQTDALARQLKQEGRPITIVTLAPKHIQEDNVRDVPRVFVPSKGQSVVGVDDVTRFLSQMKE